MDGVPMVTQCPINTGNSFRYVFYAAESGTFAWHAHSGVHRANGVLGHLVIREAYDPNAALYDYDLAEHNILLNDWDNHMAEDKNPGVRDIPSFLPNSILINGHGSYHCPNTDNYTYAPMAVFYVQRGKRFRFRIANIGIHVCPLAVTVCNLSISICKLSQKLSPAKIHKTYELKQQNVQPDIHVFLSPYVLYVSACQQQRCIKAADNAMRFSYEARLKYEYIERCNTALTRELCVSTRCTT